MKVIITSKNIKTNNYLKETIEKKLEKLSKYFADDIEVNVMLSSEKKFEKMEATIRVKGTIFRAESKTEDIYESVDKVVDKLSRQMSKFKGRIQDKHKDNREFKFGHWPEEDNEHGIEIVKKKRFALMPMSVEEAAMQMELLGHNFFVFLNEKSNLVSVVYSRDDEGKYGVLETTY